jgi:hypothetical protein
VGITPLVDYSEAAVIVAAWYLLDELPQIRRIQMNVAKQNQAAEGRVRCAKAIRIRLRRV